MSLFIHAHFLALSWMDIPQLFIHSPGEGHVNCFQSGQILITLVSLHSDFSGSPVVKSSPCSAGGVGSIPGRGTKIPYALQCRKPKHTSRNNIVTHSIKTLKMVHIKIKSLKRINKSVHIQVFI